QDWLLVDHDPALLRTARAAIDRSHEGPAGNGGEAPLTMVTNGRVCRVSFRCADLARLDEELFEGRTLVTASALLDLVSAGWVERLAQRCRAQRAAVLLVLTYDGRMHADPAEPEDAMVRDLVARHQHTD